MGSGRCPAAHVIMTTKEDADTPCLHWTPPSFDLILTAELTRAVVHFKCSAQIFRPGAEEPINPPAGQGSHGSAWKRGSITNSSQGNERENALEKALSMTLGLALSVPWGSSIGGRSFAQRVSARRRAACSVHERAAYMQCEPRPSQLRGASTKMMNCPNHRRPQLRRPFMACRIVLLSTKVRHIMS